MGCRWMACDHALMMGTSICRAVTAQAGRAVLDRVARSRDKRSGSGDMIRQFRFERGGVVGEQGVLEVDMLGDDRFEIGVPINLHAEDDLHVARDAAPRLEPQTMPRDRQNMPMKG